MVQRRPRPRHAAHSAARVPAQQASANLPWLAPARPRPLQIKLTFAAGALRMGRAYRFDAYAQNSIGWGPRSEEPLVDQVPYYPA